MSNHLVLISYISSRLLGTGLSCIVYVITGTFYLIEIEAQKSEKTVENYSTSRVQGRK